MPTTTPSPRSSTASSDAPTLDELTPILDAAVHRLPATDRDAILLRYFANKPLRDVATALAISEDAAKKRCTRAVEKLRQFFTTRGLPTTAVALAALLPATNTHAAPPAVISTACGFAAPASAAGPIAALAKSTLFLSQMKSIAVTAIAAVLVLTGATAALLLQHPTSSNPPAAPPQNQAIHVAAPAPPADPLARLAATGYALRDDEYLKLVRPPFPPERGDVVVKWFFGGKSPTQDVSQVGAIAFQWTPTGQLKQWMLSTSRASTVGSALRDCLDLAPYQLEIPNELLAQPLNGDWVVRRPSAFDDRLRALEPFLRDLPKPIRLEKRRVEREVIVARGAFALRPLPGLAADRKIHVGTGDLVNPQVKFNGAGGGTDALSGFFNRLADTINQYVIDETLDGARHVTWAYEDTRKADDHDDARDSLLDNVARQTSLRFVRERRTVDVWYHVDKL